MKIVIDRDLCQGHGVCCNESPELFALDEDQTTVRVLIEEPDESHRDALKRAVKYCPTFAIGIED